ncbi:uncharacterized protein PHALS_02121 [Plasmopara halstedii]|uniref:Uncharacterized protein n=1 Tax=Plasmopara halstedii TaxID=4781 RepID=A0A0P1AYL5_PLAHL|nr:uncharacterized protein PHALS_02121 [Plasmopara halstedii]CEG45848.1 hypothetical protein PHALS_02121 [Plasmopara halstedii]|eukprot:XP_024582217.1 hypothetical protein PHALS_02121 [Plasmopara halstedii]
MLRARSIRTHPPSQSQRLIWNQASDLISWLRHGLSANSDAKTSISSEQQQPKTENTPVSVTRLAAKDKLRPKVPTDVTIPTFRRSLNLANCRSVYRAFGRFVLDSKHRLTSTHLMDAWQIISQCRPFIVSKKGPYQVRLATAEDVANKHLRILQIVPANIFAQLLTTHYERAMFIGSSTIDDLDTDIIVASETVVVGCLVEAFNYMNDHKHAVSFFEAYDRDRRLWLQEHQIREASYENTNNDESSDGHDLSLKDKLGQFETVTELSRGVYSSYLRSLAALKLSKKIVQFYENDEHQLKRICGTVSNLHVLLHACYNERNGKLARKAIDAIILGSPAAVIPLGCYELAIRANLRHRNRGTQELLAALDLANVLASNGGYKLKPDIWSALIKVSLNMDRPDIALEVFQSYPHHCIPETQYHFRQALRAACRLRDTTAPKMMHFRWLTHKKEYSNSETLLYERTVYQNTINVSNLDAKEVLHMDSLSFNSPAFDKEVQADLLNMMLWEMLKHSHAMSSIVQVLDLMEATCSKGSTAALRQSVVALLQHNVSQEGMSSRAAVEHSLSFWEKHSSVLRGQGFLVLLLLDECLEHKWDDDCEFLVDFLLDRHVAQLPIVTIVKIMGMNEARGRFEANARIGEKLLRKLSKANRRKLRDDFYERLLMSYFRLEQFDKVSNMYATNDLEKRYPHNEKLRTIVHDAAAH